MELIILVVLMEFKINFNSFLICYRIIFIIFIVMVIMFLVIIYGWGFINLIFLIIWRIGEIMR